MFWTWNTSVCLLLHLNDKRITFPRCTLAFIVCSLLHVCVRFVTAALPYILVRSCMNHQIRLCHYCHCCYAIIPLFPVARMWSCSVNKRVEDNQDRLSLALTTSLYNIIFIWLIRSNESFSAPMNQFSRWTTRDWCLHLTACRNRWLHHRCLKAQFIGEAQ